MNATISKRAPGKLSGARFSVFLLLFAAGCALEAERADLRVINGKEPESLDPAVITGQADGRVVNSLFEGLTRYNPTNAAPDPGLAERWEISDDGLTYTFFLRTNATWSTGERITAEDFVYSWFRVLEPATASDYVGNLFYIRNAEEYHLGKITRREEVGIQPLDDHTLRVELENPTPFFLDLCAFPTQSIVPGWVIEEYGDEWLNVRPLPSSGAYELIDWRLNDRIRVRKNPRYWDAANVFTKVADFMPVNSPNTALTLFIKGDVDIVWDKDVVPTELIDVLRQRPDFHVFDYLGSYFYRYNVTRKPFDDVRVRKAMALVIDKPRLVRTLLKGGERASSNLVPPGVPGYKPPEGLGYDPELGRKLLAEAGYPGGQGFPRIEYLFNTSRDHEKIGVELQHMWKEELGIDVGLRSVEWKVYLNLQSSLDYDISRSSWIGDYLDPNTFLDMFMSSNPNNRTGWSSQGYDELMRQANATRDVKKREELLQRAEAILIREEMVVTPLYIYVGMNMFDPEVIQGIHNEQNLRDEHPLRAIRKIEPPES